MHTAATIANMTVEEKLRFGYPLSPYELSELLTLKKEETEELQREVDRLENLVEDLERDNQRLLERIEDLESALEASLDEN